MTRLTMKQAKELGLEVPRPSKYRSRKVVVDGIRFDSKKEADKYCELKLLKKAGIVKEIVLQPLFLLQPAYMHRGKKIRAITYRADFKVTYADGRIVVIDVKGYRTKEYQLKKKMFLARYPEIEFEEC